MRPLSLLQELQHRHRDINDLNQGINRGAGSVFIGTR